jgi:hypothetical protein
MSTTPAWVEDWLTPGRYAKYLRAAGGNHDRALAIYEWNNALAAALFRDLSHLEVGLRNGYDRALLDHPDVVGRDWLDPDVYRNHLFARHMALDDGGNMQDKNATPRSNITSARKACGYDRPDSGTPRGKVIAELMFGFWSYLTDSLHEKTLWVPALHTAYEAGADRARIHAALTELRELRNRIAHHESVFDRPVENYRRRVVYVAANLSTDLKDYIVDTSKVAGLLREKP